MAGLLDLAPELHAKIFLNLPFTDVCRCMLTCRNLYASICLSIKLKYQMQLESAGLQDNPYCKMSISDRFAHLQARESSWGFFQERFVVNSSIPLRSAKIYDLTSSVYLLAKAGDENSNENLMMGIQHLKLPSLFSEENDTDTITWSFMNLNMHIVKIGTSIEENDLLVCIVRTINEDATSNYTVILLRYSTMEAHDGSENPIFLLLPNVSESEGTPSIAIEVSGENLAIVPSFENIAVVHELDCLHVYDWKTGRKKTDVFLVLVPALVFLREDILLNANAVGQRFDIYYIPPSSSLLSDGSHAEVRRIHHLLLPPKGRFITSFSCFCRPNPTANAEFPKYTDEKRPYANDPTKAIVRFDMTIRARGVPVPDKFVMIVHRQALLDLVPLDAIMEDSESSTKDLTEANGGVEKPEFTPSMQPWESWGPPITRWFDGNEVSSIFASTNSGQRCVQFTVSKDQSGDEIQQGSVRDTMHILDFNPWSVRIAHLKGLGKPDQQQPEICTITVVGATRRASRSSLHKLEDGAPTSAEHLTTEIPDQELQENICPSKNTFTFGSQVIGRLPYIRVTSGKKVPYSAVLMNEEVLMGMQFESGSSRVEASTIMYFG